MKELVEKIRAKTIKKDENIVEEKTFFKKEGFKGLKISKENFKEIKNSENEKKICFIDGGNSEIISANNLSVQAIRTAATIYENNKKVYNENKNLYAVISFEEEKIIAETIPKTEILELKTDDESLIEGRSIAKISKIGSIIRRIEELKTAISMIEKADIIILDGSLEEKYSQEKKYLEELYQKADKKSVIAGLCKTNNLITDKGNALSTKLINIQPEKLRRWHYHPVAEINSQELKADIVMIKLHEKSKYIFRLDIHNGIKDEIISLLAKNSEDPVFIGYPYGLIETDRLARISNKETEYLKTKLMIELGKDWHEIKKSLNTQNAHEILDNI